LNGITKKGKKERVNMELTSGHSLRSFIEEPFRTYSHLIKTNFIEKNTERLQGKELKEIVDALILSALDEMDVNQPDWTFVAAHYYMQYLYSEASKHRGYQAEKKYGSFYDLIQALTEVGIYSNNLLESYTEKEINELEREIDSERDNLFTYIGVRTLADRYLAKSYNGNIFELPQERYMIIAMTLMSKELKEHRLTLVKEAYWAMSNQYMTVATPTFSNAGKSYGQLSSCFIDTVADDLRSIYDSNTDIAEISKNGGGIGAYLGKIRSKGSDIRGFEGVSNGVISWMKGLNTTAVNVDQLG
jgi:ribonucleoside-diphosphate reductase alpha chain